MVSVKRDRQGSNHFAVVLVRVLCLLAFILDVTEICVVRKQALIGDQVRIYWYHA